MQRFECYRDPMLAHTQSNGDHIATITSYSYKLTANVYKHSTMCQYTHSDRPLLTKYCEVVLLRGTPCEVAGRADIATGIRELRPHDYQTFIL